jgi:hypothetical protein
MLRVLFCLYSGRVDVYSPCPDVNRGGRVQDQPGQGWPRGSRQEHACMEQGAPIVYVNRTLCALHLSCLLAKNISYIDFWPAWLSACVAGSRQVTRLEAESYVPDWLCYCHIGYCPPSAAKPVIESKHKLRPGPADLHLLVEAEGSGF